MSFKVTATADGVRFSIDHQTFTLLVRDDPDEPLRRHRWYARQLRIALKRLSNGGVDAKK